MRFVFQAAIGAALMMAACAPRPVLPSASASGPALSFEGARLGAVMRDGQPRMLVPLSSVTWGGRAQAAFDAAAPHPFHADFETPEGAARALTAAMATVADLPKAYRVGARWWALTPGGPVPTRVAGYVAHDMGELAVRVHFEPLTQPLPRTVDRGEVSAMDGLFDEGEPTPTPTVLVPRPLPATVTWAAPTPWAPRTAAATWAGSLATWLTRSLAAADRSDLATMLRGAGPGDLSVWAVSGSFGAGRHALATLTVNDHEIPEDDRVACANRATALLWVDAAGAVVGRLEAPGAPSDGALGCGQLLFRIAVPGRPDGFVYELPVWTTNVAALYLWEGARLTRRTVYSQSFD